MAALLLRQRPAQTLRILARDGRKHASPNSGLAEAAMAGALGVQLGGLTYYDGQPFPKPTIGDAVVPLSPQHIRRANGLMYVTAGLFLALILAVRVEVLEWYPTLLAIGRAAVGAWFDREEEVRPLPTRGHDQETTPSPRYSGERVGVRGQEANAEVTSAHAICPLAWDSWRADR